jgi:DnaJ domain
MSDHYLTLGVSRSASEREIARAYRRLARRYHPDVSEAPETTVELFYAVQEAYETLSDARRRARHDSELARRSQVVWSSPPARTDGWVRRPAGAYAVAWVAPPGHASASLEAQTATSAMGLVAASALLLPLALVLAETLTAGYGVYLLVALASGFAVAGSSFARSLSLRELERLWRWTASGGRATLKCSRQAREARRRIEFADRVTLQGRRLIIAAIPVLFLLVHP